MRNAAAQAPTARSHRLGCRGARVMTRVLAAPDGESSSPAAGAPASVVVSSSYFMSGLLVGLALYGTISFTMNGSSVAPEPMTNHLIFEDRPGRVRLLRAPQLAVSRLVSGSGTARRGAELPSAVVPTPRERRSRARSRGRRG